MSFSEVSSEKERDSKQMKHLSWTAGESDGSIDLIYTASDFMPSLLSGESDQSRGKAGGEKIKILRSYEARRPIPDKIVTHM